MMVSFSAPQQAFLLTKMLWISTGWKPSSIQQDTTRPAEYQYFVRALKGQFIFIPNLPMET